MFNIISCIQKISMSWKTDCINRHFTYNSFFRSLNQFIGVHYLFGQSTFNAITCKDNSIFFIRCPFKKKISTQSTLKHSRACHNNQRARIRLYFILLSFFEIKRVQTLLKLYSQLVTHHVSMSLKYFQSILSKISRINNWHFL